jgi:hypothetical protein
MRLIAVLLGFGADFDAGSVSRTEWRASLSYSRQLGN